MNKHLINSIKARLLNESRSASEILTIMVISEMLGVLKQTVHMYSEFKDKEESDEILSTVRYLVKTEVDHICHYADIVLTNLRIQELDDNFMNLKQKTLERCKRNVTLMHKTIDEIVYVFQGNEVINNFNIESVHKAITLIEDLMATLNEREEAIRSRYSCTFRSKELT